MSSSTYSLKQWLQKITGYHIHKLRHLPVGTDVFIDIRNRIGYAPLSVIFDVGANVGQSAIPFALANRQANVYCFEPIADAFRALCRNTSRFSNIQQHQIAFGERTGSMEITLAEWSVFNTLRPEVMNRSESASSERIMVETIDGFCAHHRIEQIDFLKVDSIGYEIPILKGASRMLAEDRVTFIYADSTFQKKDVYNTNFNDLHDFLYQKNFLFYGLYRQNVQQLANEISFAKSLWINRRLIPQ
jgi:FkbM family methyltransferase